MGRDNRHTPTGAFICAKHAAKAMIGRGEGGKIISIGSMFSIFGTVQFSYFATAKTGVLGLTRALAVELAPENIQVNAILPCWYETDLTRGLPDYRRGCLPCLPDFGFRHQRLHPGRPRL